MKLGTKPGSKSQGTIDRQTRRTAQVVEEGFVAKTAYIEPEPPNVNKMNKTELIEYALSVGLDVSSKMTIKAIKSKLKAK